MNQERIINALNSYERTQESLEKTVDVFVSELGENWTEQVFQKLGGLPPDLKEKLNDVFNYYASLTAWNEAQTYLNLAELPDSEIMEERLPVLKHWLDFFGEPGQNLYRQLEAKIAAQAEAKTPEEDLNLPYPTEEEAQEPVLEEEQGTDSVPMEESTEEPVLPSDSEIHQEVVSAPETLTEPQIPISEPESEQEPTPDFPYAEDSEEVFTVKKALKMIRLLDDLQAWLSSRCLELGNIEVFAYPYYGMLVDLMRQSVKAIQGAEALQDISVVNHFYEGGLEALRRKRQAIESDIQVAVENCESDTTALIDKNVDLDKVKKTLGDLDESNETEYLGPAPDGFELLEEETPFDEKAVKEQYQKLEEETQEKINRMEKDETEKKTSQNPQNSVQRKLSFSLKPKKT